jgi:hypothetical protein
VSWDCDQNVSAAARIKNENFATPAKKVGVVFIAKQFQGAAPTEHQKMSFVRVDQIVACV